MIKISYLIDKFKGKYRIKVPYNRATNDFSRKLNDSLEDIDCYISCQHGNKVFHYGGNILQAYIPSIGRANNILKSIDDNLVFDIEKTDSEVLFKFKYSNSDKIIPLLKPKTGGANISPFSSRNLPKSDYIIPDDEIAKYKDITSKIPQEDMLKIKQATDNFIKTLVTKKMTLEDIKADMKLKCLRNKEYIHSIGKFTEYIQYLSKEFDL